MVDTRWLPSGFGVAVDPFTRVLAPDLLFGGSPPRVVRLSGVDRAGWRELEAGVVTSAEGDRLARYLLDAGLLHPRPESARAPAGLEVVVPVKDRAEDLDACLGELGLGQRVIVVDDGSVAPGPVAEIASRHGARLLRRPRCGGPAAARNDGLAATTSAVVAFVDSDVRIASGALDELSAHLADPAVAAAAPRVRALGSDGLADPAMQVRTGLDLGTAEGPVRPGSRLTYVPTAVLVARRIALVSIADGGSVFDPGLRYGEDVDLVSRLHLAGWQVRYDPRITAEHREPTHWSEHLSRRFAYGTASGPLGRRHPHQFTSVRLRPWPTAVIAALILRRPGIAMAVLLSHWASMWVFLRRRDLPRRGLVVAGLRGVDATATEIGRAAAQLAAPAILVGVIRAPRRGAVPTALLLVPILRSWWPQRRAVGGGRFVLARLAEDVSYGAGIWWSCLRSRTARPLVPRIGGRSIVVEHSGAHTGCATVNREEFSWPIK